MAIHQLHPLPLGANARPPLAGDRALTGDQE